MDRDTVISILKSHHDDLTKQGVKTLALFGSVARNEAQTGSDVDLLVEMDPPYTFDRYITVKFYLEDLLGCSVDLVFPETLKPRARPEVENEAIYVT